AVERGGHGVVLAYPKRLASGFRSDTDVQDGQRSARDLTGKTRGDRLRERWVRLDRDYTKAALEIVGRVVAVVGSDVDDQIRSDFSRLYLADHRAPRHCSAIARTAASRSRRTASSAESAAPETHPAGTWA